MSENRVSVAREDDPFDTDQSYVLEDDQLFQSLTTSAALPRNTPRATLPKIRDCVAEEIMSTPALACREGTPIDQIVVLLADREVSGLSVLDDNDEVVGVISERDLAATLGVPLIRLALRDPIRTDPFILPPRATRAREIMSTPPIVAFPDTPIYVLAEKMTSNGINRIPIVVGKKLIGLVTRHDVLAVIGGAHPASSQSLQPPHIIGERSKP